MRLGFETLTQDVFKGITKMSRPTPALIQFLAAVMIAVPMLARAQESVPAATEKAADAKTEKAAKSDAKPDSKSNTKAKESKTSATKSGSSQGDKKMSDGKNPVVKMETSLGTIEIELFKDKAPLSAENFLKYVDSGHFNSTIFHRVIPGFMIQGGGFTSEMQQKPTLAPIKNEATNGEKNARGTLAMARTNVVDSATAQFFINVNDNTFLNHSSPTPQGYGYAVFGKVVSGMDIVDKIVAVPTTSKGMHENVPVTPVVIKSVTVK